MNRILRRLSVAAAASLVLLVPAPALAGGLHVHISAGPGHHFGHHKFRHHGFHHHHGVFAPHAFRHPHDFEHHHFGFGHVHHGHVFGHPTAVVVVPKVIVFPNGTAVQTWPHGSWHWTGHGWFWVPAP